MLLLAIEWWRRLLHSALSEAAFSRAPAFASMFASALPCVVYHLRSELDVRWLASCGRVYTTEVVTNYRLREYHATAETRDRESPRNESNGFGVSRYTSYVTSL